MSDPLPGPVLGPPGLTDRLAGLLAHFFGTLPIREQTDGPAAQDAIRRVRPVKTLGFVSFSHQVVKYCERETIEPYHTNAVRLWGNLLSSKKDLK